MPSKKKFPIVYSYIMGANPNPDELLCGVPLKINSETIFFGPCMKKYRKELYSTYLKNNKEDFKDIEEDIYFLGMNARYKDEDDHPIRKILWFGKLKKVLTFEKMFKFVQEKIRLSSMEKDDYSERGYEFLHYENNLNTPLHLKPIPNGYELCSDYHTDSNYWIEDIIKKKDKDKIKIDGKKITLVNPSNRKDIFVKDCCLLFENIFFAEGKGMIIDDVILKIFKERLNERNDEISSYYIFGKDINKYPIGRQGSGLKFEGNLANKLIECVSLKAKKNFRNFQAREREEWTSAGKKC